MGRAARGGEGAGLSSSKDRGLEADGVDMSGCTPAQPFPSGRGHYTCRYYTVPRLRQLIY